MLCLLVGFWVASRCLVPWSTVFPAPGQVRLLEADPYFHLRHARFVARHFPAVQRWDVATHYPVGQRGENQGGYDILVGALALVLGAGHPSDLQIEQVAAWTPVLLGGLCVLALYALARRFLAPPRALLAVALFVLFPGLLLPYSLLGFGDHHVAEVLLALLSCQGVALCAARRQPWWRPAWLPALPLAAFLYSWPGAALYVALTVLAFLLMVLLASLQGRDAEAPAAGAAAFGLALGGLYVVPCLLLPDLVLSRQGLVIAALAVGFLGGGLPLLSGALARLGGVGSRPGRALLAALALLALIPLAHPQVQGMARALLETRTRLISEHVPVTPALFTGLFGLEGWLGLAALGLLLVRGARGLLPAGAEAPLVYGSGLLFLWWKTRDFGYTPPPFLALACAWGLPTGVGRLARPWLVGVALAGLLLLPFPLGLVQPPWPTLRMVEGLRLIHEDWIAALTWLRERTPPPTLALDAPVPPFGRDFTYPEGTYGVLVPWDFAHFVAALGGRPVVWSETLSHRLARLFLTPSEEAFRAGLRQRTQKSERVRYVILESRTVAEFFLATVAAAGQKVEAYRQPGPSVPFGNQSLPLVLFNDRYRKAIAMRLYLDDGQDLGYFRLVYESPGKRFVTYSATPERRGGRWVTATLRRSLPIHSPEEEERYRALGRSGLPIVVGDSWLYGGEVVSTVKIFECVAGATLEGQAPPGAQVEARLPLVCRSTGRHLVYRRGGQADSQGRFRLVVPYATGENGDLWAPEPYHLSCGSAAAEVRVRESEVLEGGRVAVGRLEPRETRKDRDTLGACLPSPARQRCGPLEGWSRGAEKVLGQFLLCGDYEQGICPLCCQACGTRLAVPRSCKTRLCPS